MPPTKKVQKASVATAAKTERYIEAVGRRKTAIARVRVSRFNVEKKIEMIVNGKSFLEYFALPKLQSVVTAPCVTLEMYGHVSVLVSGGGIRAQAEAVRLGLARALTKIQPELRPKLKSLHFLKRDPRMVERKKPGKRKARRPQQWRKR